MTPLDGALAALTAAVPDGSVAAVGGCTYCYTPQELVQLARPAATVPDELLSRIAFEVPDHWSDFAGFYRRFTPRIMAALVAGRLHVDEGLVAHRLAQAGAWTTWPRRERDALLQVVATWWDATLSVHPRSPSVTETLDFVAATPFGLDAALAVWSERLPGPSPQLADLRRDWGADLAAGRLVIGWEDDLDVTDVLTSWLTSWLISRQDSDGDAGVTT